MGSSEPAVAPDLGTMAGGGRAGWLEQASLAGDGSGEG